MEPYEYVCAAFAIGAVSMLAVIAALDCWRRHRARGGAEQLDIEPAHQRDELAERRAACARAAAAAPPATGREIHDDGPEAA